MNRPVHYDVMVTTLQCSYLILNHTMYKALAASF